MPLGFRRARPRDATVALALGALVLAGCGVNASGQGHGGPPLRGTASDASSGVTAGAPRSPASAQRGGERRAADEAFVSSGPNRRALSSPSAAPPRRGVSGGAGIGGATAGRGLSSPAGPDAAARLPKVALSSLAVGGTISSSGGVSTAPLSPPPTGAQSLTAREVQEAEQALPACQREQADITLAELEEEAASPLGIQC